VTAENVCEKVFHRQSLRAPGHERRIVGLRYRDRRFIELSLFVDGLRRGGKQIRRQGAPVLEQSIAFARARIARAVGTIEDGRFTIDVRAGKSEEEGFTVLLQPRDALGVPAGREIVLTINELGALEVAFAWLQEAS
jgi:hypothetical protein